MNFDSGNLRSDYAFGMGGQLSEDPAFKLLDQELSCKLQNPMLHQNDDGKVLYQASLGHVPPFSPVPGTRVGLVVSTGFHDSDVSCSGYKDMTANAKCDMLGLTDRCYTRDVQKSSKGGPSLLVGSDGENLPSLVDVKQISAGVIAPEQVPSFTGCTNTDWYLGGNMVLDECNRWLPEQISPWIVNDAVNLSSMSFSKPKLSHESLTQYGRQMLQSKPCHLQACHPPAYSDISLDAPVYGCTVGQQKFHPRGSLSEPHSLPLKHLQRFQQQGFSNAQPPTRTQQIQSMKNILFSYINYRSMLRDDSRSQQSFVDHLHLIACNIQKCECEKYQKLLSHFDNCPNAGCELCVPVHQLFSDIKSCPITNITSGLRKRKGYFSGCLNPRGHIVEGVEPTSKRMKMDCAVSHDDWSLGAVVHPHLGMDTTKHASKMMELLKSSEDPAIGLNGNATADCAGTKSTDVCFKKTNYRLLDKAHSFEGQRNLHTLSKEVFSSMANRGKCLLSSSDVSYNSEPVTGGAVLQSEELSSHSKRQEVGSAITGKVKIDTTSGCQSLNSDGISGLCEEPSIGQRKKSELTSEAVHGTCDLSKSTTVHQSGSKLEGLKRIGASLTDFFTAQQIKEHLHSLRQCTNLSDGTELTGSSRVETVGENTCQLCHRDQLRFTARPTYCTSCVKQIKPRSTCYWTTDDVGERNFFCTLCYKESRGCSISFGALSIPKANLHKDKVAEEYDEEKWVQCDMCERWQHQICALYNSKRDLEGKLNYVCPLCRLADIEGKNQASISPALEARDLPRTKLSDHIEHRLFCSLERERKQRAESSGKTPEEVPGAEDLKVRVVSSINKQLKVKKQFLDILHGETYPEEFPYKSKVILLFQRVEGADVVLFAMYVQEYGSECGNPNKRSIYISYLDSLQYFRPQIHIVTGVALRTFVYHEILIGYLDYCKRRGFTTCYIWACPPLKGEDYILHCHPQTQKRPNSLKLRQWYKKMLRKAVEENIVMEFTNFYDDFFIRSEECKSKITAARLPCFDGDYWSSAIENIIGSIQKGTGEESARKAKNMTKRTLKAMGHSDISDDAMTDIRVMGMLREKLLPVKEDLIVVRLQFTCSNCHEAILCGIRWSCKQCSNFHLCSRCVESKQIIADLPVHTTARGEGHQLCQIPVNDVAASTDDNDILLDNDVFENRQILLNFCRKQNYQFDTPRHAKYSSMMIVHHLHEETVLTMRTICSICHQHTMVEWHCEICSEFYVCSACYHQEGDGCHAHKLVQNLTKAGCGTKSKQTQQQGAFEFLKLMDLLKHANQCVSTRDQPCSYTGCLHLKKLFLHILECTRRVAGGCNTCRKIWSLLQFHSRGCRDSNCSIPRCRDIKVHTEKLAAQSSP